MIICLYKQYIFTKKNIYFGYNCYSKKLLDHFVNKKVCLYYRGMLFISLNIEIKIAISILEEEIE